MSNKSVCDICGPKKHRRTLEEIENSSVELICRDCLREKTMIKSNTIKNIEFEYAVQNESFYLMQMDNLKSLISQQDRLIQHIVNEMDRLKGIVECLGGKLN